ncbi:hypothetical protein BO86DRAFT_175938 [Aspergillus japonicus CBS 114.51]|uniref:Uncharacterized protein n=1 Tax=Aspergillus japonicus CBS 114.51 TaxID=1448312 RepID=A0A8T8WS88_ASPJA|nr:hypothetical protein BO86DRAFT_175938 [Aspergillus japonicus CBS 114.51]RAH78715.1 hypothetical protein BO86DRAFT_175938 [Aspergillus japonicus CBS 114.51]
MFSYYDEGKESEERETYGDTERQRKMESTGRNGDGFIMQGASTTAVLAAVAVGGTLHVTTCTLH